MGEKFLKHLINKAFALYWAWSVSKKSHNIRQMVLSIVTLLFYYTNLFYSMLSSIDLNT